MKRTGIFTRAVFVFCFLSLFASLAGATPEDRIVQYTGSNTPQLDPAQGTDRTSCSAYANIYDPLMFQDYEGNLEGGVAESWNISDDGLTYTFAIRKGIRFHNGDELTAEDVLFSMERLLAIKRGFSYLFSGLIKNVAVPSENTVVMELSKPFGPFLKTLAKFYIVNKSEVLANLKDGNFGERKDYGMNWLMNNDAGSGPYKVAEMAHNQHLYAVKFPEYWRGFKPGNPEGFRLLALSEPVTVRTMMLRKQLEFTDEYQPVETYHSLQKTEGIDVFSISNGKMLYLSLNNAKAPTDCPHFRKAISYAIDYDSLLKIFAWRSHPKAPVAVSLIGGTKDLPYYTYDLAKAKEELAKSRYADTLDKQIMEIAWIADVPDREKLALAFQATFADLGINVEVTKEPWAKFVDQASRKEDTPNGATLTIAAHYSEAGTLLRSVYHSSSIGSYENMSWKAYPEVDDLIDAALRETNEQERIKKYIEAQKLIVENQPHIPIFEEPEIHAYQSGYLAWEPVELVNAGKTIVPGLDLLYMRGIQFK